LQSILVLTKVVKAASETWSRKYLPSKENG